MKTKIAPFVFVSVTVCFAFVTDVASAIPQPRPFNAMFNNGAIDGVACEWQFNGEGTPFNDGAGQGIRDLPPESVAIFMQTIPFCTPGARYRATVELDTAPVNCTVWIGLAPDRDSPLEEVQWRSLSAAGEASSEAVAHGNNCRIIVMISTEGSLRGEAVVRGVQFMPLGVSTGLGNSIESNPSARAQAQTQLQESLARISGLRFDEATEDLESVVRDLPDARPEAARALVALQEVRHSHEYEAYKVPQKDRGEFLGLGNLRAARELYPDQEDSCALAESKLGEFYLYRQIMPIAGEILNRTLVDYPDVLEANWARAHLVNYHLWSGDVAGAEALVAELKERQTTGNANIQQVAWAKYFLDGHYLNSLPHGPDRLQKMLKYYDGLWDEYKDSFPELAVRGKLLTGTERATMGEFSKAISDFRTVVDAIPVEDEWSYPARRELARILFFQGWLPEHKAEALALMQEVADSPGLSQETRHNAAEYLTMFNNPGMQRRWLKPFREFNTVPNGYFEEPTPADSQDPQQFRFNWRVLGDGSMQPNWPGIDWHEGAPGEGLGNYTPAWNSVNTGRITPLRSHLISGDSVADSSSPFQATAWVSADAWDGGNVADATFTLNVRFIDGFNNPLGEATSGPIGFDREAKSWWPITVTGITPENTCFAILDILFQTEGNGHHAVAISSAEYMTLEENHAN